MSNAPRGYDSSTADEICQRIASGNSLRTVCRDPKLPGITAVLHWLARDEAFATQYTRACEERASALVEDALEVADAVQDAGKEDGPRVNAARLKVDTIKWFASKLYPRRYGERQHIEHSGSVGLGDAIVAATSPRDPAGVDQEPDEVRPAGTGLH